MASVWKSGQHLCFHLYHFDCSSTTAVSVIVILIFKSVMTNTVFCTMNMGRTVIYAFRGQILSIAVSLRLSLSESNGCF